MKQERNNDEYNHPQNENEINQQVRLNKKDGNKAEQKIAVNPNPRANENIKDKEISTNENAKSSHTGSEITDGEDG
jgi:hypothetical protein